MLWLSGLNTLHPQSNPGLPTCHTSSEHPLSFLRVTPPISFVYPWLRCCCAHILLLSMPSLCLQVWPVVSFLTVNGFLSETSLIATSHLVTAVFPSPPMLTSWPQILLYLLPPTTYFYFCFPKRPCSLLLRYLHCGPFISSNDFPAASSGLLFFLPVSCRRLGFLGSLPWSLRMLLQSALHPLVMRLLHVTDSVCMCFVVHGTRIKYTWYRN